MAEAPQRRAALVLGTASPIGAALLKHPAFKRYETVVLADAPTRLYIVRALTKRLGLTMENVSLFPTDARKPFAGIDLEQGRLRSASTVDIFNLSHARDRSLSALEIREHNDLMCERMISIACKLPGLRTVLMLTDIGLVGDYPGRFSENWIDVGQTPFDEVDRSSIAVELACLKEKKLPLVRARVGLVLDPEGVPSSLGYWPAASDIFVGFSNILKRLPRMMTIPVATAKGALIPVTPADFAAEVLLRAVERGPQPKSAIHLVLDPLPSVDAALAMAARRIGGARLKSGLPIDKVAKLGLIPGFRELARRNADQLASWWTPHRYCLSRNDVDTSALKKLLPQDYRLPKWNALEPTF